MTDLHDHRPLSRVELMVLARLTAKKAPTPGEITKSLKGAGLQLTGSVLTDCVAATLAALQGRAFIASAAGAPARPRGTEPSKSREATKRPKAAAPRFTATESGRRALRDEFGLDTTPTWATMCEAVVPALGLGVHPGSESAAAALGNVDSMIATLLRRDPLLGEPRTINQLCDQVIARALGMPPGPVTPAAIRAYALAVHCGTDNKSQFLDIAAKFAPASVEKNAKGAKGKKGAKGDPLNKALKALATRFAQQQLRTDFKTKEALARALRRRWLTQQDEADDTVRLAPSLTGPLRPVQDLAVADACALAPPQRDVPQATAGETLLTAVREAIPMIGSDGRYGRENVFVSALWRRVASDRKLPELSLDHFKRWLVAANRDQLIDLARADLVDAMDAKLVEESEIADLGATFHFVIDRQELAFASGQVSHAR